MGNEAETGNDAPVPGVDMGHNEEKRMAGPQWHISARAQPRWSRQMCINKSTPPHPPLNPVTPLAVSLGCFSKDAYLNICFELSLAPIKLLSMYMGSDYRGYLWPVMVLPWLLREVENSEAPQHCFRKNALSGVERASWCVKGYERDYKTF